MSLTFLNTCAYSPVSGFQSWDSPPNLPGPVSPRERDALRPGAAHRQDHGDAPCAEGEPPRALESGRPQPEEDGAVSMLRRHDLHCPLEVSLQHVIILVSIRFDLKMISRQIISSEWVSNICSSRAEWFSHLYSHKTDESLFLEYHQYINIQTVSNKIECREKLLASKSGVA